MSFLLTLLIATGLARADVVDRVAAVVNNEVIALSEIYDLGGGFIERQCSERPQGDACWTDAEKNVLDSLIQRVLVKQELSRLGMKITAEDLQRAMDQIATDNGIEDREVLRASVEKQGLTWDVYREQLREQLRQMRFAETVIGPMVTINEDELLDMYQRSVRGMEPVDVIDLQAFMVKTSEDGLARARALVAEIRQGKKQWLDVVQEVDVGGYAARGGVMGTFQPGELLPAIGDPAFALTVGQVSDPIAVGDSVFVLKIAARRNHEARSFEEAQQGLRGRLLEQKTAERMEQWAKRARKEAAVRVLLGSS